MEFLVVLVGFIALFLAHNARKGVASAYLAAVYLAADAARRGQPELEDAFWVRALGAGVIAGGRVASGGEVLAGEIAQKHGGDS